ncbi:MAG: twin-arginine translocase TatA/TatE family subunit [Acidobacteria bacterium]|jgi:TatA/E family protein of Tat protein translocase|nr:twin-arginine translocase TatA/TatE family subunit [Acidobacteriota bacterium]
MLIGLIALIVFGPRKIPELARTIGKLMMEFRRSTDDFKRTWEQEAKFGDSNSIEKEMNTVSKTPKVTENSIGGNLVTEENRIFVPEVREINYQDFEKNIGQPQPQKTEIIKKDSADKRDWL